MLGAILGASPIAPFDFAGIILWAAGFLFEAVGDWRLAKFRTDPANCGKVMERGLWAYTRHPNYLGDCCIWWRFHIIAASAGAWWSIASPLVMSALLMRVSGVSLLEKDIADRRQRYAD